MRCNNNKTHTQCDMTKSPIDLRSCLKFCIALCCMLVCVCVCLIVWHRLHISLIIIETKVCTWWFTHAYSRYAHRRRDVYTYTKWKILLRSIDQSKRNDLVLISRRFLRWQFFSSQLCVWFFAIIIITARTHFTREWLKHASLGVSLNMADADGWMVGLIVSIRPLLDLVVNIDGKNGKQEVVYGAV